ncbi:formylglycine-generating enzyme family protein [bacterium]|nr:formylglycine-generating enzyme family protein [bacterium]
MSSMILIPSGPFVMGLSKHEVKRICRRFDIQPATLADTMPQRMIELPDFYMDKYPVTNAEFYAYVIEANAGWIYNIDNPVPKDSESLPAVNVTYDMAESYAAWAGKRLPTEQEWEKAARGKPAMLFPWGGVWESDRLSCSVFSQGSLSSVGLHPMGSSPYGVMDMAGNVWEWTSTSMDKAMVIKGGSFRQSRPYQFMCSFKEFEAGNSARDDIGFRCVMDMPFSPDT